MVTQFAIFFLTLEIKYDVIYLIEVPCSKLSVSNHFRNQFIPQRSQIRVET